MLLLLLLGGSPEERIWLEEASGIATWSLEEHREPLAVSEGAVEVLNDCASGFSEELGEVEDLEQAELIDVIS